MTHHPAPVFHFALRHAALACLLILSLGQVTAQPSQTPLLTNTAGAKPNLMIALDNSGSMAYTYHDAYAITGDNSRQWAGQRSADVNPVYYNPRTTYLPRVNANGQTIVPTDDIRFVSNQQSVNFEYRVFSRNGVTRITHSTYASNPTIPILWTEIYGLFPNPRMRIPQHVAYTNAYNGTPSFTYSYCTQVQTNANGDANGCTDGRFTNVNISFGSTSTVSLPADHQRTDCTSNTCTNSQEIANILNWYRYYIFRASAASTSIGLALANPSLQNKLRVGYININENGNAISKTPGVVTTRSDLLRGVRTLNSGTSDNNNLFDWLYGQVPDGGTPLHNVLDKSADYYRVGTGAKENPWATNPAALASKSNPEMSCRRSFNLLFSDGAWSSGSSTNSSDFDNTDGNSFSRTQNGITSSFRYRRLGVSDTKAYTPYPSTATTGLADLTAEYFWHEDLRTSLANDVNTRVGQPTFWQNMATYTVGYLIQPSGEIVGATSGLTFSQIKKYQADYARTGYTSASKPSWSPNMGTEDNRVDDFIQAGFTGGGAGFSARDSTDVRNIFNSILSDILNSSGSDAGVAVSSSTADNSTIVGRLKYGVSYRTLDNSGEITAQKLDANGNVTSTEWTASSKIPAHGSRRVFSMSGTTSSLDFTGAFNALPADVQTALKTGPNSARIGNSSDFVDYLRGKDPVTDTNGTLFRQRTSGLGAMVNPPSIYMGGQRDNAYDLIGDVAGASSYLKYADNKRLLPASLYVATNAGMVHALSANTGDELAAFMPRRSMKRMLKYADPSYTFEYVLDGPVSENDIYDGSQWNHVAVGTGGRGERLVYALRSPLNTASDPKDGDRIPAKADFMWETGPDLMDNTAVTTGYMTNSARSGQTENGNWVVVLNSGHFNGAPSGGKHGLVVLDAMTGQVIRNIALPSTFSAGRGLSGVTLVRNDNKRIVAAYAGDAQGNLWRFDLTGAPANWKVSYGKPLFTTANNRPIYGAPAWQVHPKGGAIVVMATGMLLEETDLSDTGTNEAIYGVWDPTILGEAESLAFSTAAPSNLLEQTIDASPSANIGRNAFFNTSRNVIDWTKHRGWTMRLGTTLRGERSIDQIRNLGTSVFIATTVLDTAASSDVEMCNAANLPANYLYGLRALDGVAQASFDTDGDGKLDKVSMVLISEGGYSRGLSIAQLYKSTELTAAIRKRFSVDESAGESLPTIQKCSGIIAKIVGTEDGALTAGVACPASGWSRSQYQLSRPPGN